MTGRRRWRAGIGAGRDGCRLVRRGRTVGEERVDGGDAAAVAAFERAAELFGGLGNTPARVRCLRSAAWVRFRMGGDERPGGVGTMRSVLSSLESLLQEDSAEEELVSERDNTAEQLERMLKISAEEGTAVD